MTKTSRVIEAARQIERNKKGFTVPELMSTLNWEENQKQYVQTILFILTRKGQAVKLSRTRPVLYSLKTDDTPAPAKKLSTRKQTRKRPKPVAQPDTSSDRSTGLAEIPLRTIEEEVFRRNRELERKVYVLEKELLKLKSQPTKLAKPKSAKKLKRS